MKRKRKKKTWNSSRLEYRNVHRHRLEWKKKIDGCVEKRYRDADEVDKN